MREIYNQAEDLSFNTNDANAETPQREVISCDKMTYFIFDKEGDHANHVLHALGAALKVDGTSSDFIVIPNSELNGLGFKTLDVSDFAFIKIAVKTPEGALSVIEGFINPTRTI